MHLQQVFLVISTKIRLRRPRINQVKSLAIWIRPYKRGNLTIMSAENNSNTRASSWGHLCRVNPPLGWEQRDKVARLSGWIQVRTGIRPLLLLLERKKESLLPSEFSYFQKIFIGYRGRDHQNLQESLILRDSHIHPDRLGKVDNFHLQWKFSMMNLIPVSCILPLCDKPSIHPPEMSLWEMWARFEEGNTWNKMQRLVQHWQQVVAWQAWKKFLWNLVETRRRHHANPCRWFELHFAQILQYNQLCELED